VAAARREILFEPHFRRCPRIPTGIARLVCRTVRDPRTMCQQHGTRLPTSEREASS
jgi:hypothetical protein